MQSALGHLILINPKSILAIPQGFNMMIYSQLEMVASRDAFIVLLMLLLIAFAISKVAFPKVFSELISPNKLFGFRVREDLGTNLRPFSSEHLYFTALSSLSISFVGLCAETSIVKIREISKPIML